MIISLSSSSQLTQAFFNRLAKLNLTLTTVEAKALFKLSNNLESLIAANKFKAIYPIIGGVADTHALNLISDTFPITWNGAMTHSSNGVEFGGGYGDTTLVPSAQYTATDYHEHTSIYINKPSTLGLSLDMACCDPTQTYYFGCGYYDVLAVVAYSQAKTVQLNSFVYSNGLVVGTRTNENVNKLYIRGVEVGVNTESAGGSLPTRSLLIGAINDTSVAQFSNARVAFVSIGMDLQLADVVLLNSAVTVYQQELGRA